MPRPRNPEGPAVRLGGQAAVNFTIRLPLDLALKIEDRLHEQMRRNMMETGSRAEASVGSLFRAALEHYLACPEADTPVPAAKRGRPRKSAEVSPAPKAPAKTGRK